MIVGLHSSVFGKSILEWVCCAWWWELGHTICLVCLPAWCVWLQPNTDLCRWRIWATWSIQLQWAVLQSHLLVFCWRPGCVHLHHGLWFLPPTGKAPPLLTCWQCSASCSPGQHWQDMVSLVFTSEPSLSSDHLIFIQSALCPYLCFSLFLSRCGAMNFLLLEIFLSLP